MALLQILINSIPQQIVYSTKKIRKKRKIERNDTHAIKWNGRSWRANTFHEMTPFIVLTCNKERFHKRSSMTMSNSDEYILLKFISYYSEMDLWIRGVDRLTMIHRTLNCFWKYIFTNQAQNVSEIETKNNFIYKLDKDFIFNFRIYKHPLTSSTLQTFVPTNLCLLLLHFPY